MDNIQKTDIKRVNPLTPIQFLMMTDVHVQVMVIDNNWIHSKSLFKEQGGV